VIKSSYMNPERRMPIPGREFHPASETEKDIPERLRQLHEVEGKFLSRGVFFDVYAIDLPDEDGKPEPLVFKDFRGGDVVMSPEEQVSLFQHQYYEWIQLQEMVGEEFFPKSDWIRSTSFTEDQAHGFYETPGKTANTMLEFIKVQLDRQLADRYSSDDKRKGAVKQFMSSLGSQISPKHETTPFIGAIIQERVNGISFAEALKHVKKTDPTYERLREATRKLISKLREYHAESDYTAFTWHGLGSDNVMVEVDENGKITGRVVIVDANFTERPNKTFKDGVVKKIEENVFKKLEHALEL